MDDELTHEFQIGPTGPKIKVKRPTAAQMFVLVLSRESGDPGEQVRLVKRLTRVLEALIGVPVWDSVIEEGMISGTIEPIALLDFTRDIIRFDWDAYETSQQVAPQTLNDDVPGSV